MLMKIVHLIAPFALAVTMAGSGCASQGSMADRASAGATNTHLTVIGKRPDKVAKRPDPFYQYGNWDFLKPMRDPSEDWRGGS
jgi:hypothetical protein